MGTPSSIFAAFLETAQRDGARPLLHIPGIACKGYSEVPIDITYDTMCSRVLVLADRYQDAGYGAGARVALVLENRPCFFEHFLALNSLGASIVPLSAELRPEEMRHLAEHSDTCLVVTVSEHQARIQRVLGGEVPVVVDGESGTFPSARRRVPSELRLDSDEAALLYTSGTTGKPKGCVLSNPYFLECGRWYLRLGGLCALQMGEERLITPLPLNHSNALAWSFLAMLLSGGCLIQLDRFHPQSWWDAVRSARATVIHYLGVMPALLLKGAAEPGEDFGGQIKFGFGAGVDPRHQRAFEKRFGFPLVEAWAMTEFGAGAVTVLNSEPRHVGTRCIGRPESGLAHRIVDEGGAAVAVGAPGELLVRRNGPDPRRYFFSGYYKDPEATAEAWAGGWFHTGDVVREDKDGYLYFVDRRKNIVRRSGENIASVEVEGVLLRHPLVKNCAVAPVSDEVRGEEVFAFIVMEPTATGSAALAAELFDFGASLLAYFKLPAYIAFVETLPLTASQKIKRGELRRLAEGALAEGKAIDMTGRKSRARASSRSIGAMEESGHG